MDIKPKTGIRRTLQQMSRFQPKKAIGIGALAGLLALASLGLTSTLTAPKLQASDHDDGDIDVRSRALSLTDLYVFREIDQNPGAGQGDLILVMNTNPRSVARQQYYFSNNAQYDINIGRVANVDRAATGNPDLTLRFTFSEPNATNRQRVTLNVIDRNGRTAAINQTSNGGRILTTPLTATTPTLNSVTVRGANLTVFAGLREDPFFFDVEQFFRVRAGLANLGPAVGFRPPATAQDFAKGYNANSIVVRVPKRFLAGGNANVNVFDAWLAINIPDPRTGRFVQTEHLARPAVNEGLILNQSTLAAYNRLQPRGVNQAIVNEAKAVLGAIGNSPQRTGALLGAFVPDVMRIDTTVASGYANKLNALGAPAAGRMFLDDVIDITLGVLSNGAVTSDNVSYTGTPGNPGQGHRPLVPAFPYLAPAN